MKILSLDYETYSEVNLLKCGLYRYVDDKSFEPLLLAYAYDDEPVHLIDFAQGEKLPAQLLSDLYDPSVQKHAFNAAFERTVTARICGKVCPPEQWRCTMIHASCTGLPRSLKDVGRAMRLPEDQQKMKEGSSLIQYFCVPCKPTKKNGNRTRNNPSDAPDKWQTFRMYCIQDVETERVIRHRLEAWPVADRVWEEWFEDQRINDRGVKVDIQMAIQAVRLSEKHSQKLTDEAIRISGLSNPNSVSQLKGFLDLDEEATLRKEDVAELMKKVESGSVQ